MESMLVGITQKMANTGTNNMTSPRARVYQAIDLERKYQDEKFPGHTHTVAEYILLLRKLLDDAEASWYRDGNNESLHNILELTATGVACLEEFATVPVNR